MAIEIVDEVNSNFVNVHKPMAWKLKSNTFVIQAEEVKVRNDTEDDRSTRCFFC